MEQRIPLSQGKTVQQFIVDRVIGFGASCLVYEAHYLDSSNHRKEVILKECYPCNTGTSRIGNKIIWSSAEEQEKAFLRFDNAYEIAAKIQNVAGAKSVSVYSLDKLTENGTQYVATIPNGTSYDKNGSTDIADIIRTALALTNAVGLYHKAGYLHLDIKPSNFIATEDQTGKGKNIVLFDVDTIVSQNDIQKGNLRSVSYSKECAAPEQKMQQIKKLCPATDLFAIGAVLFERIMNKPVDSSDSTLFSEWEFDSRFDAKKVNPKAKRLLTDIFHKTLAANVKRRYQSAEDLATALEELLEVACSKAPYIISTFPISTCDFVGRKQEIKELETALSKTDSVFVSGSGGIGKTELVKQYISLHKDDYDAIVFMVYNTTVSACLLETAICHEGDLGDAKINILRQLCDKKTLFVLDNFDVSLDGGNELNALLGLHCKVIVTTRTDFSEIFRDSSFLTVSGLSVAELNTVFEKESGVQLSDKENRILSKIYHLGKSCTYFWTLVARLTKTGDYSVSEIVKKVLSGLDELEDSERIVDTKDSLIIKRTLTKAMSNLFKLERFKIRDYRVLETLYFLDGLTLSRKQIKDIFALCDSISTNKLTNAFEDLLEKGYIESFQFRLNESFRINDVLKNVMKYELNPHICQSEVVRDFIEKKLSVQIELQKYIEYTDTAQKDKAAYYYKCLFSIFIKINWSNTDDVIYFIDLLYSAMGGEAQTAGLANNEYSGSIFTSIYRASINAKMDVVSRIKALIIVGSWSCHWSTVTLFEEFDEDHKRHIKDAETVFAKALEIINDNSISDETLINDLCKPYVWAFMKSKYSAIFHLFSGNLIDQLINLNPICLRNEQVTPQKSFLIRVLLNEEYESIYLEKAINHIKTLEEYEAKQYAYITIGRILLNGGIVSSTVPENLRLLRKEVFGLCRSRFYDEYDYFPQLEEINPLDFAPDPLCMPIGITIGQSIERFRSSLVKHIPSTKSKEKDPKQEQKQKYQALMAEHDMMNCNDPILFNKKGERNISLFFEALDTELTSNTINYIIEEFRLLVDIEFPSLPTDDEVDSYVKFGHLLKEKVDELVNEGTFETVVDYPYIDKDADDIKTEVESVLAVVYAKTENDVELVKSMEIILAHSKGYLFCLEEDEITDLWHGMNCDTCFWSAFNRIKDLIKYSGYATTLLIEYSKIVSDYFDADGYCNQRMYNYYKEIIRLAIQTVGNLETSKKLLNAIFEEDNSDLNQTIKFFQEIAESYTYRIEEMSDQEYHP